MLRLTLSVVIEECKALLSSETSVITVGLALDWSAFGALFIGKSRSLSRELRRKSQTLNLLGETMSLSDSLEAICDLLKTRLLRPVMFSIRCPIRLFFGDGSTSVSEKSEKSELVAAVSEPLSTDIGTGEAVIVRRRLNWSLGWNVTGEERNNTSSSPLRRELCSG